MAAAQQQRLDDRNGSVYWPGVLHATDVVVSLSFIPADLLNSLKERLKSETAHVVLNTLTVKCLLQRSSCLKTTICETLHVCCWHLQEVDVKGTVHYGMPH